MKTIKRIIHWIIRVMIFFSMTKVMTLIIFGLLQFFYGNNSLDRYEQFSVALSSVAVCCKLCSLQFWEDE